MAKKSHDSYLSSNSLFQQFNFPLTLVFVFPRYTWQQRRRVSKDTSISKSNVDETNWYNSRLPVLVEVSLQFVFKENREPKQRRRATASRTAKKQQVQIGKTTTLHGPVVRKMVTFNPRLTKLLQAMHRKVNAKSRTKF